jgi:hypothetical protein
LAVVVSAAGLRVGLAGLLQNASAGGSGVTFDELVKPADHGERP